MSVDVTESVSVPIALATIAPDWKALSEQYSRLCSLEDELTGQIAELGREIERVPCTDSDPRRTMRITTTQPSKGISDAARQLLGAAAPPPEPPPAPKVTTVSYDDAR